MRQEENTLQTLQTQKTEYAAVENSKESQQVPRLFHFLKLNRDRVDLQTQKQLMFDNKNLTQIVRQLGKQLNKQQVQYNKIYVGNLCNFILIVKRPRYSNFLSLLNSTFYSNLTSIFKDVVLYWKDNEHNDKSQVARAKIIAFLKILTQMHMNKKNYPRKVFGQGTLHVLRMIDPSKDEKVLRFFLKIIFQCQIFINNKLKVDFAQIMYKSLKFKHFPLAQFNKTIRFVQAELSCHYLQSYEFKNQIVKNCKNILIQNLSKEDSFVDLKSLAIFINSITANQKEYEMTLTQFSQVCNVAKNKTLQQNKISCLKELVKNIKIDTNQQKLDLLMAFTGENHIIKNSLIKLLPEVIKKLSSGCLIEILDSQLLQKIIYIIKDKKYPRAERFSAVQVYKILCMRMKEINHIIYEHMIQSLAYLKEVFHESHDKEIEQAFHMDQVQMDLFLRFTLN